MPNLTYDIGYYGKVTIAGMQLLATGGSVSIQHSPMFTSGIWGAYWKNATDKVAYANNYITLSANVNYQFTDSISSTLASFAFSSRSTASTCTIYPNGVAGFSGAMYCTGCGFSTSQDSLVTGDISFKTGQATGTFTSASADSTTNSTYAGSYLPSNYTDVYAYWQTYITYATAATRETLPTNNSTSSDIADILDWNATYSSDLIFASVCQSSHSSAGLLADYCVLGAMNAQGSFTKIGGIPSFISGGIQDANTISIHIGGSHTISFGAILWTNFGADIQTGTSLVQSTISFQGLGNQSSAPMNFS